MKKINLAVVGATGNVGRMILQVMEEKIFPWENCICFLQRNQQAQK